MDITIKDLKTAKELKEKSYVHWKSWQETYPGKVNQRYLAALTPERCEEIAYKRFDNTIIAKDGDRVIGFADYGEYRNNELPDTGEIFALYVLAEYYGHGVGKALMLAALGKLAFSQVAVWVLKGNDRAIRFYEKCGFRFDGCAEDIILGSPVTELRMILKNRP